MDMRVIGQRIEALRYSEGLTIEQFADRVGVSARQARSWEKGENRPQPNKVKKIAEALSVDSKAIFCGTDEAEVDV